MLTHFWPDESNRIVSRSIMQTMGGHNFFISQKETILVSSTNDFNRLQPSCYFTGNTAGQRNILLKEEVKHEPNPCESKQFKPIV